MRKFALAVATAAACAAAIIYVPPYIAAAYLLFTQGHSAGAIAAENMRLTPPLHVNSTVVQIYAKTDE